jgi:hypothetical protein
MLSRASLTEFPDPSSGFDIARARLNALTQQSMQNRLLQAQGNLAQQQANFTPFQLATNALANTALWSTPEGRQMGLNLIKSLPTLASTGINNKAGNTLQSLDSPSLGRVILNNILDRINGKDNSSSNAIASLTGNDSNASQNPLAENNITQSGVPGVPNTPASQAAQQNLGGLIGAPNPIATAETNTKAQEANVLGQVGNQTDEQKQFNKQVNSVSTNAVDANKFLEGWWRNYNKSSYKGRLFGTFPTSGHGSLPNAPGHNSSPEQLAETYQQKLIQSLTQMEGSPAALTDEGRSIIAQAKGIGLQLDGDAAKELYESTNAGLKRMQQSRQFVDSFTKNNPNETIEHMVAMMNAYNKYAPSYDYENGKALPENDNKFKDFTSKEALNQYLETGDYNPYEKSSKNTGRPDIQGLPEGKIEKISTHNGKPAYLINGQWYGVSS